MSNACLKSTKQQCGLFVFERALSIKLSIINKVSGLLNDFGTSRYFSVTLTTGE